MEFPIARICIFPVFRLFVKRVVGKENLPKNGAFILAIKHLGSLDGFFFAAEIIPYLDRNIHFFANNPNWFGGLWKKYVAEKWSGTLTYYDKERSLARANELLQSGKLIGIFPEGRLEEVYAGRAKAKTGAARLAIWNKVPLVPVGIHHVVSKRIGLPALVHRRKVIANMLLHPRSFEVHIGKPFTLSAYYDRSMDKPMLHEATQEIMQRLNLLTHVEEV